MITLEEVFEALNQGGYSPVRRGDMIRAKCPAHGGGDRNLAVTAGHNVSVLTKCHSHDCEHDDVMEALGFGDRSTERGSEPIFYVYRNPDGKPLYAKKRDGKKMTWWSQDAQGEWTVSGRGDGQPVPYRLPELLDAIKQGETVYVCEGEKDADIAHAFGLCGTTFPDGAGSTIHDHYRGWFHGADVVVIGDRDDQGEKYAQNVIDALAGFADSVIALELPFPVGSKKDLFDFFSEGHTVAELQAILNNDWREPGFATFTEWAKDAEKFELYHYDMPGLGPKSGVYLPGIGAKTVSLIGARSHVGKTAWAVELAWRAAIKGRKVMFLSFDEPGERMPKYIASSYHCDMHYSRHNSDFTPRLPDECGNDIVIGAVPLNIAKIERKVRSFRPHVLIVDHLGRVDQDSEKDIERIGLKKIGSGLRNIADKYRLAVVALTQFNRTQEDSTGLATQASIFGADALGHGADVILAIEKPAHEGCGSIRDGRNAENVRAIDDDREAYRGIHVVKNRFGGVGGFKWFVLCGPERRMFQLHPTSCECSECAEHRRLIATRGKRLSGDSSDEYDMAQADIPF